MSVPTASEVLAEADRALAELPRVALCQIVRAEGSTSGKTGWKLLVRPDGSAYGNLGGGAFEALVKGDASALLAKHGRRSRVERYYLTEEASKGQATGMVCGGMVEVFLEILEARPALVICGGGPVGQALARQAALGDFEIAVADDREEFLEPGLFPEGTCRIQLGRAAETDFLARLRQRDLYVAVVSRCWETDLEACEAVLAGETTGLRYLGLMGSRRKIERVVSLLAQRRKGLDGVPWFAPIGLDIGATTPAEIALSIVSEIVRERNEWHEQSSTAETAVRMV